jgi:hypothetical protein
MLWAQTRRVTGRARRSVARVFAVLVVALWAASPAAADDIRIRIVPLDGVPDVAFLDDVIAVVGRMHAFYEDSLGLQFGGDITLTITVIDDRATYLERARAAGAPNADRSGGFFSRATGGVVWRGADTGLAQGVLVHEISHELLSRAGRRVPLWLNEGLAEVVRGYRIQGNAIWLEPEPHVLAQLRNGIGGWRPNARLVLTSDAATWASLGATAGQRPDYDHGSMLVGFLLSTPEGTDTLKALLAVSGRGLTANTTLGVVEVVYPGGLARLESDWVAWWSKDPRPVQLPIRPGKATLAPQPTCAGVLIRRGDADECVR